MGDGDAHRAAWVQKRIFCLLQVTTSVFSSSLKKGSPRNQNRLRYANWWFVPTHFSQPYSHRSEVVKFVIVPKQRKILVDHAHNSTHWKICLLGQAFCEFPWGCSKTEAWLNVTWNDSDHNMDTSFWTTLIKVKWRAKTN